ncbi:hypothetical protein Tco_0662556 [Tanacetum coccineum]
MTESTMEEYMMKTREDYCPGVARPNFDKDAKFKLKGQFIKELRDHTFSGSENKDANKHTERVLEIVDLFTTPDVTQDQLMLRVFPITLTGAASRWLTNELLVRLRLDVLARQILDSKGGVPKMNAADAKKAIQEMANYSQKWHDGTSTRSKSSNTYDGLAAIQAQLKILGREIKKVNERVSAAQIHYELCNGPHYTKGRYKAATPGFYQRDNGNTTYQEKRQMMEEILNKNQGASIKALEIQIRQMSKVLQEKGSVSPPSSAETTLRDHVKSITPTKETETLKEDDKMPLIELIQATIPFPGRLKENGYDEIEVLKELKKLKVNSTESATSLRRLLKEKSRIEEEIKATMKLNCSPIIEDALPPKEKYPGIFTLPCSINNMCFDKALTDLGSSVSVIPYSTFTNPDLVFKSDSPTSNIIKKVYVFGLREQTELELEARLMGDEMEDLDPEIEDGEIIDEPKIDIVKNRYDDDIVKRIDEYPSFYDYDRKIHIKCGYNLQFYCMIGYEHVNANFFPVLSISVMSRSFYNSIMKDIIEYEEENVAGIFMNVPIFVGNFSVVTDFLIVENMDAYHDKDMGNVFVGKPFCRVAYFEARRFDGFITIYDGNDSVTYQIARSHPRFKHLFNKQCNRIRPLLQVSARDILEGNSHSYNNLKGFFKGVLNLGPEYIKKEKMVKWLTLTPDQALDVD